MSSLGFDISAKPIEETTVGTFSARLFKNDIFDAYVVLIVNTEKNNERTFMLTWTTKVGRILANEDAIVFSLFFREEFDRIFEVFGKHFTESQIEYERQQEKEKPEPKKKTAPKKAYKPRW